MSLKSRSLKRLFVDTRRFPAECLGGVTYAGSAPDCFLTGMSIIIAAVATTKQTTPTTMRNASQMYRDFVCMYMPTMPSTRETTHKADNDGKSSDTSPAKNLESLSFKDTCASSSPRSPPNSPSLPTAATHEKRRYGL